MKKLLGIIVLGLMFISIDLSNPTTVKAAKTLEEVAESLGKKKMGWFEKKLDDLNPANYFKKRKKCKERADHADTVADGKIWYKQCMGMEE
jgi:hypothetical protein